MPKHGVATHRSVVCAECGHQWLVGPAQVGKARCPKCANATRLKAAATPPPAKE